jgi:hypothetical protein
VSRILQLAPLLAMKHMKQVAFLAHNYLSLRFILSQPDDRQNIIRKAFRHAQTPFHRAFYMMN